MQWIFQHLETCKLSANMLKNYWIDIYALIESKLSYSRVGMNQTLLKILKFWDRNCFETKLWILAFLMISWCFLIFDSKIKDFIVQKSNLHALASLNPRIWVSNLLTRILDDWKLIMEYWFMGSFLLMAKLKLFSPYLWKTSPCC